MKITVRLHQILHANLDTVEWTEDNPLPILNPSILRQICDKCCVRLDVHEHDSTMDTAELRGNDFNFEQQFSRADGELDDDDVEEEDDEEDDDGDSSQSDGIEADEDTSEEDEWK